MIKDRALGIVNGHRQVALAGIVFDPWPQQRTIIILAKQVLES